MMQIAYSDGLPQSICKDCLNRFIFFRKFLEECENGQKNLISTFRSNRRGPTTIQSENSDLSNSQGNDSDYSNFEECMMEILQDKNIDNQVFENKSNHSVNLYSDSEEIDISAEMNSVLISNATRSVNNQTQAAIHVKKQTNCRICQTKLNIEKLHEHLVEKHKPIILKKCTESVQNIEQHVQKEHSVKISCNNCEKSK